MTGVEGIDAWFHERRSLVITANLPFARRSEVFLDATAAAAVIDRVVHHATILKTEGESDRLQDAERAKARKWNGAELPVALVQSGSRTVGVVVDRFVNEIEVMIEPLRGELRGPSPIEGSTILGDGRIVLVSNPGRVRACVAPPRRS